MNTATRQGAADPDTQIGEVVVTPNPRNVAIEAMTQRMEAARTTDLAEAIEGDPGLAHAQASLEDAIDASNAAAIADGTLPPPELDDGAAYIEPLEKEVPAPAGDPLPADLVDDPLSEFIVMDSGAPMFRAKVNGEDKLIPLDQARRQIQIGTAAEVRMQQASLFEQETTRTLDERERGIATREAALLQRTNAAPVVPIVPASVDLSEEDLLDESRDFLSTAFSGTEEDAAKKLAKTLSKLRAPAAIATAPVDEQRITHNAAKAAVQVVRNDERNKDATTGLVQFKTDYPEIMKDANLYKMADDMTDVIEIEHPEWDISQVMDEAGKRTRAWVNQIKGVDPEPDPDLTPAITPTPVPTQHPPTNRQERKSKLVRMPQAAAGAVHEVPAEVPEEEQSPIDALNELKESRGQPT